MTKRMLDLKIVNVGQPPQEVTLKILPMQIEIKGDMAEVVDASPVVRVRFDYPLTNEVVAELTSDSGQWTRGQLISAIVDKYAAIYAEEESTASVKAGRASEWLLNRNVTDGVHGIWGHALSDLILCDFVKGDDGVYDLES